MMKGPLALGTPKASVVDASNPPTLGSASARNNGAFNSVKNLMGGNRMTRQASGFTKAITRQETSGQQSRSR